MAEAKEKEEEEKKRLEEEERKRHEEEAKKSAEEMLAPDTQMDINTVLWISYFARLLSARQRLKEDETQLFFSKRTDFTSRRFQNLTWQHYLFRSFHEEFSLLLSWFPSSLFCAKSYLFHQLCGVDLNLTRL